MYIINYLILVLSLQYYYHDFPIVIVNFLVFIIILNFHMIEIEIQLII